MTSCTCAHIHEHRRAPTTTHPSAQLSRHQSSDQYSAQNENIPLPQTYPTHGVVVILDDSRMPVVMLNGATYRLGDVVPRIMKAV